MIDYIRALKRPFSDPKNLAIGVILNLPIPVIGIITKIFATGYIYESGIKAEKGEYDLPQWKNYKSLWIQGFVGEIITLVYLLPVIIISYTVARNAITDIIANRLNFLTNFTDNPLSLLNNYGYPFLIVLILLLIEGYLLPIAILNWITRTKISSAFDFKDILKKAADKRYFTAWLILTIISITISSLMLAIFPIELLKNPNYNLTIIILFSVVVSTIKFIEDVFKYTIYGNVMQEL